MSDYPLEPQSQDQGQTDPGSPSLGGQMARYTIHIPVHDNAHNELSHVLGAVRKALTQAGYKGRTVIRRAQGDWNDHDTHETDLVMVDAPDDPSHFQSISQIAQGVKQLTGQEAVYMTKQPIESYLI